MSAAMRLAWDQVLAWRMNRQFLDRPEVTDVVGIVRRLCGVQAQVASSAALAVAVRQASPQQGQVEQALADRELVRTWAMRGTLHLLSADEAAAYLALVAAARTWEKGAWQRAFATTSQLAAITDAVRDALEGRVLTREELVAAVVERTGDAGMAEQLRSGWGAVLKPLAWQGHLCHVPSAGNRVMFTRPDTYLPAWRGLPDQAEAARVVVPAYLRTYGPATMETFDQWLCRGASKRATLRAWFAQLDDELVTVEVEGEQTYARAADIEELAATRPSTMVRLLPSFDQYVLGPGTGDTRIVPAHRRRQVSKAAGWISPVVVVGGRVAGTWEANGERLEVVLFDEAGPVSRDELDAETARIGRFLGTALTLSVS